MTVYIEIYSYDPETGKIAYLAYTPNNSTSLYRDARTKFLRAGEKHSIVGRYRTYHIWQDTRAVGYYPMPRDIALQVARNHYFDAGQKIDFRD